MNIDHQKADVYVPVDTSPADALRRTTHLGIMAHQDDLEMAAYHGIAACFRQPDRWFAGVVVTDGAGSSRTGNYAWITDEEMQEIRRREQRKAALIGEYGIQIQLAYTSAETKNPAGEAVVDDLFTILEIARPEIVYLHNPADRHDTHVACLLRSLAAIRRMPVAERPRKVYGCEGWRKLDWLLDADKVRLDVGAYPNLAASLIGVFDSQIGGGKRYDLAEEGQRRANATYASSHTSDTAEKITFAIDLTPLVADDSLSIRAFTLELVARFQNDVAGRLERFNPQGS